MLLRYAPGRLLLVALHLGDGTGCRIFRVIPDLPPRAALAQQVPALIKGLFRRTQALVLLFRAEGACGELATQFMFGFDQPADAGHDLLVVHSPTVSRREWPLAPGP